MYEQAIKKDPESLNTVFGFRVDFAQYPPDLSFIYQHEYLSDDASDDTSNNLEAKYRGAYRRIVMNGEHRGGVFIEARVPIGGGKFETVMCIGDIEKPDYEHHDLVKRPGKVAEALQLGKTAGGLPRPGFSVLYGVQGDYTEAEYDEVDELLRRLRIASARNSLFLDEDLIPAVVEQYMADVQDPTPGRYS